MKLELSGVQLIQLKNHVDGRGSFKECYKKPLYIERGITCEFVQDNHSFSKNGVIRGMHFQPGQAKLLMVISGVIFDVFVDVRPDSPTFGKWEGVLLDAEKSEQLFIPDGYAHGFAVLSETAHVFYKVSALYDPTREMTLSYNDPEVGIEWPFTHPILSEKDLHAPTLEQLRGKL
jgi:dTDP-4-dehydrorhamnose 3,5-epimerase